PWAPPIAILGQTDTGNGIQFDGAMWAELVDTGTSGIEYFPQGLPFEIYGSEVIGISDNVFTGFNFYPNPSTDIINVTSKATINNLSVYNMLGQQLINVSVDGLNHQLNISDLSAGMYIMKAVVDGVEKSFNIVKK